MKKIARTYLPKTDNHYYVISKETENAIIEYQRKLVNKEVAPGRRLRAEINFFLTPEGEEVIGDKEFTDDDLKKLEALKPQDFLQLIMNTRSPCIFAEHIPVGPGKEWNQDEYEILAEIASVVKNVEVYDNGRWGNPTTMGDGCYKDREPPHKVTLLCVPGAILDGWVHSIDRDKILTDGQIDIEKYKAFYKSRLVQVFQVANEQAKADGKKAFITLPGIGNGVFAGEFSGKTIPFLHDALEELLKENTQWENIGCIWLDGYDSSTCKDTLVGKTKLRVRNTGESNAGHSLVSGKEFSELGQLSLASDFAETESERTEFTNCLQFKVFAWDPFSFEGNDWVAGSRNTDEANMASCNGLAVVSGAKGEYRKGKPNDGQFAFYLSKTDDSKEITWKEYFLKNNLKQGIADRLKVFDMKAIRELAQNPAANAEESAATVTPSVPEGNSPQNIPSTHTKKLDLKLSYLFGNDKIRKHRYQIAQDNNRYKGKAGDVVKREILEEFKDKIAACTTPDDINKLEKQLKNSPEYTILRTEQDWFSRRFHIKTSSVKAFEQLIKDAHEQIQKQDHGGPKPS